MKFGVIFKIKFSIIVIFLLSVYVELKLEVFR